MGDLAPPISRTESGLKHQGLRVVCNIFDLFVDFTNNNCILEE